MMRVPSLSMLASTLAVSMLAANLCAHDPGLSSSRVDLRSGAVSVALAFNDTDVLRAVPPDVELDLDRDGRLSPHEVQVGNRRLVEYFAARLQLEVAGNALRPLEWRVVSGEAGDVEVYVDYEPNAGDSLEWRILAIDDMARGHCHYASVHVDGRLARDAILRRSHTSLASPLALAAAETRAPTAYGFFELGVEHILIGYDHILFLLALLLVAGSFGQIAAIITAFTLAHSLTLGLATLDLVRLPSSLVESVIAASIVWVGIENIVAARRPSRRFLTAFGFGLVHGFGFASVLRELGIADAAGVVVPLLSFNLGVEAGQIAIAALAIPLLALLRRRIGDTDIRRFGSAVVIVVGGYWLIERLLGL